MGSMFAASTELTVLRTSRFGEKIHSVLDLLNLRGVWVSILLLTKARRVDEIERLED